METNNNNSQLQQQTAGDSIVLEEEIDPNYIPTENEVLEYAKWLGMELDKDQDLFWIAREGLMAPLPKSWKPCKTKDTEDIYYFNFSTGESTWDHPCDGYYKRLYEEEKKKKEIVMKENNDQKRSKAKQDVEILLGKTEKKKKKSKTMELGSLDISTNVNRHSLEKKPLPGIMNMSIPNPLSKEPLVAINTSSIESFSTIESSTFKSDNSSSNYNEETKHNNSQQQQQHDSSLLASSKTSSKLKSAVSASDSSNEQQQQQQRLLESKQTSERRSSYREMDSKEIISSSLFSDDRKEIIQSQVMRPSTTTTTTTIGSSSECLNCKDMQRFKDEVKSRNKTLENQLEDCEQRIQYQKQVINDSQERFDRLDNGFIKKEKELRDRISCCDKEIDSLEKERKQLKTRIDVLEEETSCYGNVEKLNMEQQQRIQSLEEKLSKSTRENNILTDELDSCKKKLSFRLEQQLGDDNNNSKEEILQLERQLEEQKKANRLLSDNLYQTEVSSKRIIDNSSLELDNWKAKVRTKDNDIMSAMDQNQKSQTIIEQLTQKNKTLEIELNDKEKSMKQFVVKENEMKDQIQLLEKKILILKSSEEQNNSSNTIVQEVIQSQNKTSDVSFESEVLSLKSKIAQIESEKGQLVIQVSRQDTELKYARMELNRIATIEQSIRNLETEKTNLEKQLESSQTRFDDLQQQQQLSTSEYEVSLSKLTLELNQKTVDSNSEIAQWEKKVRLYQEELIQMQRRLNDQQTNNIPSSLESLEQQPSNSSCKNCNELLCQLETKEDFIRTGTLSLELLERKVVNYDVIIREKDLLILKLQQEVNDVKVVKVEELSHFQNVTKDLTEQVSNLNDQLKQLKLDVIAKESTIFSLQNEVSKQMSKPTEVVEQSIPFQSLMETLNEKENSLKEANNSMISLKTLYSDLVKENKLRIVDLNELKLKNEQLHFQLDIDKKKLQSLEEDNLVYKSKWLEVEQENSKLKVNDGKVLEYEILIERLKKEIFNSKEILKAKCFEIESLKTEINNLKNHNENSNIIKVPPDFSSSQPIKPDFDKLSTHHTNGLIELSLAVGQQRATIERLEKQLLHTESTVNTLKSNNNNNNNNNHSPPLKHFPVDERNGNTKYSSTPDSISLLHNKERTTTTTTPETISLFSRQPFGKIQQQDLMMNRSNGKRNSVKFKNKIQYFDSPSDENIPFPCDVDSDDSSDDEQQRRNNLMNKTTTTTTTTSRFSYSDFIKSKVFELSKSWSIYQTNKILVNFSSNDSSESIIKYSEVLEKRIQNENSFTQDLTMFNNEMKKRIKIDQTYISELKNKWKSKQMNRLDNVDDIDNRCSLNAENINIITIKLNKSVESLRSSLNLLKQREKKLHKLNNSFSLIQNALNGTGDIHKISNSFYLSVKKLIIELNSQLISFMTIHNNNNDDNNNQLTDTSPLNNNNQTQSLSRKEKNQNIIKENYIIDKQRATTTTTTTTSYDDLDLLHKTITNVNKVVPNYLTTTSEIQQQQQQQPKSFKSYDHQHHQLLKQQISKYASDQIESKQVYDKHVGWLGNLSNEINTVSHRNYSNIGTTTTTTNAFLDYLQT